MKETQAQPKLTQGKPMKHDLRRNGSAQSVWHIKMIQREGKDSEQHQFTIQPRVEVPPQQHDANKILKKMLLTDKHSTLSKINVRNLESRHHPLSRESAKNKDRRKRSKLRNEHASKYLKQATSCCPVRQCPWPSSRRYPQNPPYL